MLYCSAKEKRKLDDLKNVQRRDGAGRDSRDAEHQRRKLPTSYSNTGEFFELSTILYPLILFLFHHFLLRHLRSELFMCFCTQTANEKLKLNHRDVEIGKEKFMEDVLTLNALEQTAQSRIFSSHSLSNQGLVWIDWKCNNMAFPNKRLPRPTIVNTCWNSYKNVIERRKGFLASNYKLELSQLSKRKSSPKADLCLSWRQNSYAMRRSSYSNPSLQSLRVPRKWKKSVLAANCLHFQNVDFWQKFIAMIQQRLSEASRRVKARIDNGISFVRRWWRTCEKFQQGSVIHHARHNESPQ